MKSPSPTPPETWPEQDEAGVDVSLIRWMLSLTPRQRLEHLQQTANFIARYGGAARATKPVHSNP